MPISYPKIVDCFIAFTLEFPTPELFLFGKKNSLQLLPPCGCLLHTDGHNVVGKIEQEEVGMTGYLYFYYFCG